MPRSLDIKTADMFIKQHIKKQLKFQVPNMSVSAPDLSPARLRVCKRLWKICVDMENLWFSPPTMRCELDPRPWTNEPFSVFDVLVQFTWELANIDMFNRKNSSRLHLDWNPLDWTGLWRATSSTVPMQSPDFWMLGTHAFTHWLSCWFRFQKVKEWKGSHLWVPTSSHLNCFWQANFAGIE